MRKSSSTRPLRQGKAEYIPGLGRECRSAMPTSASEWRLLNLLAPVYRGLHIEQSEGQALLVAERAQLTAGRPLAQLLRSANQISAASQCTARVRPAKSVSRG
jgi:hypothetical protein